MAKKHEKKLNAKQRAYQKKQEEQGRKVVNWIFGVLIAGALVYVGWTLWMMA